MDAFKSNIWGLSHFWKCWVKQLLLGTVFISSCRIWILGMSIDKYVLELTLDFFHKAAVIYNLCGISKCNRNIPQSELILMCVCPICAVIYNRLLAISYKMSHDVSTCGCTYTCSVLWCNLLLLVMLTCIMLLDLTASFTLSSAEIADSWALFTQKHFN